jgi:guanyl-specific ribonuclease Sa
MATTLEQFALEGDPEAIRLSARRWRAHAVAYATFGAEVVRVATIGGFESDEAVRFVERAVALGGDLDDAAAGWRAAAEALTDYADVLRVCQHRLAVIRGDAIGPPQVLSWHLGRLAEVLAEHRDSVGECTRRLAAASSMLPRRAWTPGTLRGAEAPWSALPASLSASLLGTPVAAGSGRSAALVDLSAGLRVASISATVLTHRRPTGWSSGPVAADPADRLAIVSTEGGDSGLGSRITDGGTGDLWSRIADLLGWAALALPFLGGGASGGVALAGGEAVGGGVLAAGAVPVAAGVGVAAAILGGALLVTAAFKGESPSEAWDDLTTHEVPGTPRPDPTALKEIAAGNRADLPPDVLVEVDKAVDRAKAGTRQYYGQDGKDWDDWRHQLPPGPVGYYKEWAAAPARSPRGSDRVIIAGDPAHPDAIYYWDHTPASPVYIGPSS